MSNANESSDHDHDSKSHDSEHKDNDNDKVTIDVDAYSSLTLHGHVDSIQQGSGSRFSAFPAENATGNFVKTVQRVPVKIVIDCGLPTDHPLPLGLSVAPTVYLK